MERLDGQTGISVTGSGRVTLEPEIATLSVGVSLTDRDLERARAAAATKIAAARDHLRSSGVAESDIATDRLNVASSFDGDNRRQTYHLSTGLEATIRDLAAAESIVNQLFTAIGDGMDMRGLRFGVEDPTAGRDRAVELAFEDARAKAVQLARLAGVSLGPVLAITETESHHQPRGMRLAAASMAGDIPIEPGQVDQRATISVRWAIDD